jgi:hypothetical protein
MSKSISQAVSQEMNMPTFDATLSRSSIVCCTEENLSCGLQGEAIVLNLESGVYFGMNPLAARIWELIQQPSTVEDVHKQLLDEYDVDAGQCEADLLSFLEQLRKNNLLTIKAGN